MAVGASSAKPVAGEGDRLAKEVAPRQPAEAAVHRREPGNRARHRNRQRPGARDAAGIALGRRRRRSRAGAVEHDGAPARLIEDVVKAVAAEPGHHRLDDAQRHGGRDRGVDRIAARPQRQQPGLRRERVVGRDGAAPSDDDGSIRAHFVGHFCSPSSAARVHKAAGGRNGQEAFGRRGRPLRTVLRMGRGDMPGLGPGSLLSRCCCCWLRPAAPIRRLGPTMISGASSTAAFREAMLGRDRAGDQLRRSRHRRRSHSARACEPLAALGYPKGRGGAGRELRRRSGARAARRDRPHGSREPARRARHTSPICAARTWRSSPGCRRRFLTPKASAARPISRCPTAPGCRSSTVSACSNGGTALARVGKNLARVLASIARPGLRGASK